MALCASCCLASGFLSQGAAQSSSNFGAFPPVFARGCARTVVFSLCSRDRINKRGDSHCVRARLLFPPRRHIRIVIYHG